MAARTRILVVDDIPLMRAMLCKYLARLAPKVLHGAGKAAEIELVEAENGAAALEILQSRTVDIVFLDLMMPEMDGLTFLRRKQQEPALAQIPVVVCSALDDAGTREQIEALEVTVSIRKPFNMQAIEQGLGTVAAML